MDEAEFLEFLISWLPDDPELWIGSVMAVCALLAIVLPKPCESAHPLFKIGHRVICVLGMGAGKLKAAGKIGKLGKIAKIFGGKK